VSIERRAYPRLKQHVPIELLPATTEVPIRGVTCDLSLGGCYVEMMFPLEAGTSVEIKLQIGEATILVLGIVKTSDPQVGNGIQFLKMLPEDFDELSSFMHASEQDMATPDVCP